MVYGCLFIGAAAAASFPSPSKNRVSLHFIVSRSRPGLLFHAAPHDVSSAHYIQGQDAVVCFRAFSPYTADRSHQEVKEVRSLVFFFLFFFFFWFVPFRVNWRVIVGCRGLIADLVVQHCREHGSVNWAWV